MCCIQYTFFGNTVKYSLLTMDTADGDDHCNAHTQRKGGVVQTSIQFNGLSKKIVLKPLDD